MADGADGTDGWLPVKDAADRLGLTVDQARRRLRSGQLHGRRVPTAQGHVWQVLLNGEAGADVAPDAKRRAPDAAHQTPDAPSSPGTALQTARAEEMATYSHRLLAPYVAQIAEQAERIGRLEAELEQARAAAPETQSAAPEWERRPWWQRLLVWG